MNNISKKCGLMTVVLGALLVAVSVASCALDTNGTGGLFGPGNGGTDAGIDVCVDFCDPDATTHETGPDAGTGGNAGEPIDASVYDSCDCGVGGAGGEAGQGGSAGQGGTAGTGGSAGAGGTAGQGGTAGAGGEGGSAGQGGTAGTGGATAVCPNNTVEGNEVCDGTDLNGNFCETLPASNFTGGTLACMSDCADYDTAECLTLTTCTATLGQTASSFYASVETAFGALLHKAEDADEYWTISPQNHLFVGATLPAQVVVTGKDSLDLRVYMGGIPLNTKWFKVDMATLPGACGGAQINSQNCLALVAKSHRCQAPQFQEHVDCPPAITFVEQTATNQIYLTEAVQMMVLVDIICP